MDLSSVLFYFAGLPVYAYGVLTSIGVLCGVVSAIRAGRRHGISTNHMYDIILGAGLTFFIFGRIGNIITDQGWGFLLRPWAIFTQLDDGLHILIGLVFALGFALLYTTNTGVFGLNFLDAVTPGSLLILVFTSLGSSVFGKPTELPWALKLGEFSLHPLPLYFALGYYLIYFTVCQLRRTNRFDGQVLISAFTLSIWLQWLLLFAVEDASQILLWVYPILGLLGIAIWSFGHTNSTPQEKSKPGIAYLVVQIAILFIILFALTSFFYARFS